MQWSTGNISPLLETSAIAAVVCYVQRAVQTARSAAKPLLVTLLRGVGRLFTATQQAACLEVLATLAEVFGEVKNASDIAEAQREAFEGSPAALLTEITATSADSTWLCWSAGLASCSATGCAAGVPCQFSSFKWVVGGDLGNAEQ